MDKQQKRQEYKKQYRIDNAEKIKAYNKQYRENPDNVEKIKAYNKSYAITDKRRAYKRMLYQKNKKAETDKKEGQHGHKGLESHETN